MIPATLGQHLRKRRGELRLRQSDVAERLGIAVWTLLSWEKGARSPSDRYLPAIIRFLGYDPLPAPEGLGEQLRAWRRRQGLSGKKAAKRLGVDEGTLCRWERGIWTPKGLRRKLVEALLGSEGATAQSPQNR